MSGFCLDIEAFGSCCLDFIVALCFYIQGPFNDYQKKSHVDDHIDAILNAGQQLKERCADARKAAKEAKDTLNVLDKMIHSTR